MDHDDVEYHEYPLFDAKKEVYSIQQLFDFLNDMTDQEITIEDNEIINKLCKIREKAAKNEILREEFKKWLIDLLLKASEKFIMNPSIGNILSEIFYIVFSNNDEEANTVIENLMESSFESCKMSLNIFEFYIKSKKSARLEPFDRVIRKIFKLLPNLDLRMHCLSIIVNYLTNSHILYESLNPKNERLIFLSITDDPISISNGLKICKKMIDAPQQKFPKNGYDFFFTEVMNSITFFANEEILNDVIILLVTKICLRMKSIDFFYLMEPNEFLFNWFSSIFLLSERYLNQKKAINNDLSDHLEIVDNLIEFWLLPPNFLKIQKNPDFLKWKEDFISLCMSFFLKQSRLERTLKIDVEIMENSSFCDNLGKHFSSIVNFNDIIRHRLKKDPLKIGNSVLISIFASVLDEREFTADIRPFKRSDIHSLHHIAKYYSEFELEPPQTVDQFLFSDALYRVLNSFSYTYLQKGRVFIDDSILNDISKLYVRTLINLQVDDKSIERLSRGIEAILSVPFEIVMKLVQNYQIIPEISKLHFDFIYNKKCKEQVEDLFDHLFSIQNSELDESLLSSIDFSCSADIISPNLFVIIRSFFKNCIDDNHNRAVEIVKPIIVKSINAQIYLGEVSKTIKTMSEKVFPTKTQSLSLETVKYVKIIIEFVHLLLEQFTKALPNEEDAISQNVMKIFTNLMIYQPINFGYLSLYNDFCFLEIIDEFFTIFYSKDIEFFCQNKDFVQNFINFMDTFIDSELENDHLTNSVSPIFKKIFELHSIEQDVLAQISGIILNLIDRKAILKGLLPSILIFKLTEEPTLNAFNKMVILLCSTHFDEFSALLSFSSEENLISDDAKELLDYICSELNSEQFEYSSQFEADFNDCIIMIKKLLTYNLFDKKEVKSKEEEEDIIL